MNPKTIRIVRLSLFACLLACARIASAQSQFYWDATSPINNSPGSGGTGNWSTNVADWWVEGATDSVWTNGSFANFEGTAGTVTVSSPVTAAGIAFGTTGYVITGTSNLTLSAATIALPSGGAESINCPLAGTTTVTVSPAVDTGTLILGGTNTYTGATTINSGATLEIGGAGVLNNGAYAGAINDSGALVYASSANQTLSGTISGTGSFTQEGSGKLTLTHANTGFTGGTTINAGSTLQLNVVAGAGSQTTITNNGTLDLNATGAANYAFSVVGGSSSVINLTMAYNAGSENLRFPGPGTLSSFAGTINLIALNSTGGTNGGTFGAGQLILSVDSTILTSPGTWHIYPGATLDITTPATPSSANVIIDGPGNSQPYGALRLDACNQTGNVLLNGNGVTIGDDSASSPSQISGNISDGGNNYGFTKAVGNPAIVTTIILSGNNTYTGPTIFSSAGALQVDSTEIPGVNGPLGKSPASNPGNIVLSGATLRYSSVNSNDYSGRFSTNASQDYNIDVNGQNVTFATPLTSSGGELTLSDTAGGGTMTLSGKNTYNGITTINSGTLNISGSIPGSTVINVNGTGNLELGNPTALSSGTILTLPSSPAANSVNLNFSGTQTILALYFGGTQQPPGTYSATSNNSSGAFTGSGILNVAPQIYWDGNGTDSGSQSSANGGGNGSWDNATSNWWVSGGSDTRWISNSIANFAGTAGTVTLNAGEIANGLAFITDGYTLNGSSNLTLAGTPTIAFPNGGAATINCPIAGTGGLAESGSGMLTLGGSNTFSGATAIGNNCSLVINGANAFAGATAIGQNSSLAIGDSGNLAGGNYPGAIVNGGSFTYGSSAPQTLSGIVSGSGSLTQNGPGALTLSGLNTFTGSISINSGSLAINGLADLGNNPTFNTGNYSGSISDNGKFIVNSTTTQTLSGGIYGTGTLAQSGSGALTLSGQNAYTGITTIGSNSALIVTGDLGNANYATNIVNDGTFSYSSGFSQILSGPVSGSGTLTLGGFSTLTLTASNSYTGGTSIASGGDLIIGDPGVLGDGNYAAGITNLGTLTYNSSQAQTLSGPISGSGGSVVQNGPGILTLTGSNSFTGFMNIAQGAALVVGGSGKLGNGSYAGAITDSGALTFNTSAKQTLSGDITDNATGGTLTQTGSGMLILTGFNAYTGTTTIGPGSVLVVAGSGTLNNGDYETNIVDNGTFAYDSSSIQTVGGVISGSGALDVIGSGVLYLTASNSYTGATVVSNGTFALNGAGSINSASVSIGAGATFDVSVIPSPYLFTSANFSATGNAGAAALINGAGGGMVNMGSQPVSLTFAPQSFTGDASHPALNVTQSGLTLNGNVITVNNAGTSPLAAGTYSLIQVANGPLNGTANLGGVAGAGLEANASASLSVSGGTLNLVVVGGTPSPRISNVTISGGKLIFSGTNGPDNGTYVVLSSTNLLTPVAQWTPVGTNNFTSTGAFSATNTIGSSAQDFFIIKVTSP